MTYSLSIYNLNRLMEQCTVQYQEVWELHCRELEKRQQQNGRFHCDQHDNPLQYTIYATAIMLKAHLSKCKVSQEAVERAIKYLNDEIEDIFDQDIVAEQADLIEQMVRAGLGSNHVFTNKIIQNANERLKRLTESFSQKIIFRHFLPIQHNDLVAMLLAYGNYHRLRLVALDEPPNFAPSLKNAIRITRVHMKLLDLGNERKFVKRNSTYVSSLYMMQEHDFHKLDTLLQNMGFFRRKRTGITSLLDYRTIYEFYWTNHPLS